jgi:hypothetical protein
VSGVRAWLEARRPVPPPDLATRLPDAAHEGETPVHTLTDAGRARLDEARARPGRVRDSAFALLEADALLTYACEAALETRDPAGALRSILASVGSGA